MCENGTKNGTRSHGQRPGIGAGGIPGAFVNSDAAILRKGVRYVFRPAKRTGRDRVGPAGRFARADVRPRNTCAILSVGPVVFPIPSSVVGRVVVVPAFRFRRPAVCTRFSRRSIRRVTPDYGDKGGGGDVFSFFLQTVVCVCVNSNTDWVITDGYSFRTRKKRNASSMWGTGGHAFARYSWFLEISRCFLSPDTNRLCIGRAVQGSRRKQTMSGKKKIICMSLMTFFFCSPLFFRHLFPV